MLAEVAPLLVPQFDALLVSLLAVAGCFVALGLVVVLHGFVRATVGGLGSLLGKLPGVGHVLSSPVNAVFHWMDSEFSTAELALDKLLARFLHSLGQLVSWMGREIGDLARLLYVVAGVTLGSTAVEALTRLTHLIGMQVRAVEYRAELALRRIDRLEHSFVARLEHWIDPRLAALEHTVDGVIEIDIAGLRARARSLTDRLENTWRQVRKLDALLGTAAVTAAVAVALTRLDLNWIRCRNWRRIGRGVCGLPASLVEALFAGAIDALVVADLCDLSYLMIAATEEIRPAMLDFVDAEEALIGCHGNTAPPPLHLPPLHLAAVRAPLALAS